MESLEYYRGVISALIATLPYDSVHKSREFDFYLLDNNSDGFFLTLEWISYINKSNEEEHERVKIHLRYDSDILKIKSIIEDVVWENELENKPVHF